MGSRRVLAVYLRHQRHGSHGRNITRATLAKTYIHWANLHKQYRALQSRCATLQAALQKKEAFVAMRCQRICDVGAAGVPSAFLTHFPILAISLSLQQQPPIRETTITTLPFPGAVRSPQSPSATKLPHSPPQRFSRLAKLPTSARLDLSPSISNSAWPAHRIAT